VDEDVQQVEEEAKRGGTDYKHTLTYRWMVRVARIVWFWSIFALLLAVAQVVLFAFTENGQAIPGSGAVYAGAATIAAAFVGGEKIVKKMKGKTNA
jgi:hypothetical protein